MLRLVEFITLKRTKMPEGRVKHANSRGFGFIETDDQIDFYFHYSNFHNGNKDAWKRMLGCYVKEEPVKVSFDVDKTANEPRAINVTVHNGETK